MAQIVRSADSKADPDGLASLPHVALLLGTGAVAVTTPTTAQIVTDADCWTAGLQSPAQTAGGPVVDATLGTITLTRAANYEVSFAQCQLTKVNSQVITLQVFAGSTAKGGKAVFTQPATAVEVPCLHGKTFFAGAVGDVISLKVVCDTGNYGAVAAGYLLVREV